jgi:hypothetical protein
VTLAMLNGAFKRFNLLSGNGLGAHEKRAEKYE